MTYINHIFEYLVCAESCMFVYPNVLRTVIGLSVRLMMARRKSIKSILYVLLFSRHFLTVRSFLWSFGETTFLLPSRIV
jgi:hypothetical protein